MSDIIQYVHVRRGDLGIVQNDPTPADVEEPELLNISGMRTELLL